MAPIAKYAAEYGDEVELLTGIDIGTLWDRLKGEFLNEYARVQSRGMTPDEMERQLLSFIDSLSPKFEEDLARKSAGVSYNAGRTAEIKTAAARGDVQYAVRSEVLDTATCAPCASLDGTVVEVGTPEYDRVRPPFGCEGGNRCRGFVFGVPAEMGA